MVNARPIRHVSSEVVEGPGPDQRSVDGVLETSNILPVASSGVARHRGAVRESCAVECSGGLYGYGWRRGLACRRGSLLRDTVPTRLAVEAWPAQAAGGHLGGRLLGRAEPPVGAVGASESSTGTGTQVIDWRAGVDTLRTVAARETRRARRAFHHGAACRLHRRARWRNNGWARCQGPCVSLLSVGHRGHRLHT